jgi:PD-(D/E)XK nuclease superfamily
MSNFLTDQQFAIAVTLATRLHWIKIAEDGVLEIYLDHHALSTYRTCPSKFKLEHIDGRRPKATAGSGGTGSWSLDFGILFHKIMEYYYINFRSPDFSAATAISYATDQWNAMGFDDWKDTDGYKNVRGLEGFRWLINFYFTKYQSENERLRVIGTELYFGKGKEVPLQIQPTASAPFRLYYSGKIDLLIDDGFSIGPLDHKTSANFKGKDPNLGYMVQEGMTGYVFASKYMVRDVLKLHPLSRKTNMILMNYIQVAQAKDLQSQFKRVPLYKTDAELEQWRLRQIATVRDVLNAIFGLFDEPSLPFWYDTSHCTNMWHRECPFFPIHRLADPDSQLIALNNLFNIQPVWNPESRDEKETIKNSLGHL